MVESNQAQGQVITCKASVVLEANGPFTVMDV